MDIIYKRRSIRKYTGEPLTKDQVNAILKAGMNAPSAGNQQPWQFVVIDQRDLLDKIPDIHPYSKMLKEAPMAILVCGDLSFEKHKGYWVQDCSAAIQNMLLEITDLNLGGCWLGVYPREDRVKGLRLMMDLPEDIVPLALLAVGHPNETKEPKSIFSPDRIHYNHW